MTVSATTGRILLDVAVILIAARAGGVLFERLGQPSVIGEIAAGIALGPTLLGLLPGDPSSDLFPADALAVLQLIGQLGLVLFMFAVGWDLDLKIVRHRERAAATVSIASILLPFALGLALAAHLHPDHDTVAGAAVPFWPFALFLGASLSLTAFPVLARILQETGLGVEPDRDARASPPPPSTTSSAGACSRSRWPCSRRAARGTTCACWWRSRCSSPWSPSWCGPLLHRVLRHASPAREALVLPTALAGAYVTDAIGIHAVFGAFLVGAAMPRPDAEHTLKELRRRLSPVIAFLAPIYFVTSGMAVDIPGLRAGDLADLVLIIAAACAGKFLGAFAGARVTGMGARDSSVVGVLMNTRGLIEIVLLTVGVDVGLIDDRLFTLLAVMAIVTTLLTSPLLRRIGRVAKPGRAIIA